MAEGSFDIWDFVVLIVTLIVSSSIGIYYRFTGGKQKTTQEYLLADRNMSIIPVAFSLMASFMSGITLLGVSQENYSFGTQFVIINLAYIISTPIAAYLYLPVFFKLQATSAYEYLEKRFGKATRLCASIVYSIQMVFYMGIVLYAPAIALDALTGIRKEIAILVIGLVCTFYSTIGGMKAVLITDVFQSLLMFAAVFSIIICAAIQAGGLSEIWRIADEGGRIEFFNFNPDPTVRHTWGSLIIGGSIVYLSLYAVNQTQVQRYMTVKDLKTAQKTLWLNWPILSLLSFSTSFSGLAIYSKYYNCDPVDDGRITARDQIMPLYVVETMGQIPGITGLFFAGIFSGSLSTISASVNSLAAVTLEDYVKPLYKRCTKHNNRTTIPHVALYTKILALMYGLICIALAFLAQYLGGVLQAALTLFGAVGGPLFGVFTLGMFTTRANQKGAIIGLFAGIAFAIWAAVGQPRPPPPYLETRTDGCTNETLVTDSQEIFDSETRSVLMKEAFGSEDENTYFYLYRISYLWISFFSFLLTLIVGYIISIISDLSTKTEYLHGLNPDLFAPPLARSLRKRQARRFSISSQSSTSAININKFGGLVLNDDLTTNV